MHLSGYPGSQGRICNFGPGHFVGLTAFLHSDPYNSTASADEPTTLLALDGPVMQTLEARHHELSAAFNRVMALRLRAAKPLPTEADISGSALAAPAQRVMHTPVLTASGSATLTEVARQIVRAGVSSAVIVDDDGKVVGLRREQEFTRLVAEHGDLGTPIGALHLAKARTVAPLDPLWRVRDLLYRHRADRVVVVEEGKPVGIITDGDLFRYLSTHIGSPLTGISDAVSLEDLKTFSERLPGFASHQRQITRRTSEVLLAISNFHRAIQERAVALTLNRYALEHGAAPLPFAVIVMGSGGRREMLLDPDQDHGLIWDDPKDPTQADQAATWFGGFGQALAAALETVGYKRCPGGVMTDNPEFRGSVSQWAKRFRQWIHHPDNMAARWSSIVFDLAPLYGEVALLEPLQAILNNEAASASAFLTALMMDDAQYKPPLGFMGRLITSSDSEHRGSVDLKAEGTLFVVDAARLFAIRAGIAERNTHRRLQQVAALGILDRDAVEAALAAYALLVDTILAHQLAQVAEGVAPDKFVDIGQMSHHQIDALKDALRTVGRLQGVMRRAVTLSPF